MARCAGSSGVELWAWRVPHLPAVQPPRWWAAGTLATPYSFNPLPLPTDGMDSRGVSTLVPLVEFLSEGEGVLSWAWPLP